MFSHKSTTIHPSIKYHPSFKFMSDDLQKTSFDYKPKWSFQCRFFIPFFPNCRKPFYLYQYDKNKPNMNHQKVNLHDSARINNVDQGTPRVALGVIPVRVRDVRGSIMTARALVDEGSDTWLASAAFVRKLGLTGRKKALRIVGVSGKRTQRSELQELDILTGTNRCQTVTVWTLPMLNFEVVTPFDWKNIQRKSIWSIWTWETPPGPIDLLLGMNHPELLVPNKVRRAGSNEPFTTRIEPQSS